MEFESGGKLPELEVSMCYSFEMVTTNGLWGPSLLVSFSLPVFLIFVLVSLATSRALFLLLKRFRQPMVIAEIITGIIWGPTLMGQFLGSTYLEITGLQWVFNVFKTAGHLGLFFFLFLVGVDMNWRTLKRVARKSLVVAAAGIAVPFGISMGGAFLFRESFYETALKQQGFEYGLLLAVLLSATSLPVVTRILAELKLLDTDLGRIALSAALINEVATWAVLPSLIQAVGMGMATTTDSGMAGKTNPLPSLYKAARVGGGTVGLAVICCFCVRPVVGWIQRRTPEGETVSHGYISIILSMLMLSGFLSDGIGIHYLFGGFVFGLAIPAGRVAETLVEMLEYFVTTLMLPLYFVQGGVNTNFIPFFKSLTAGTSTAFFLTSLITGVAKVVASFIAALCVSMPSSDAMSLGIIMSCKCLLEIILIDVGLQKAIMKPWALAGLMVDFFLKTVVVGPMVARVYSPAKLRPLVGYKRRNLQRSKGEGELRMLVCIHNSRNVPAVLSLLEVSNPTKRSPIFVYALHLVELSGRASAMIITHNADDDNKGHSEHIIEAFKRYEQYAGGVTVQPLTAIAAYPTMHNDIYAVAGDKQATIIILPFHKQLAVDGQMEDTHPAIGVLNQRVLEDAPCSVGILIDRGLGKTARYAGGHHHHVVVLFFGGPDDREALAYGWRMAEHPGITVTLVRFLLAEGALLSPRSVPATPEMVGLRAINIERTDAREQELDDEYVTKFRHRYVNDDSVAYAEKVVYGGEETVTAIRSMDTGHDLYVVGRGYGVNSPLTAGLTEWSENPELGPIGDLLASTDFGVTVSVLVVQQYVGGGEVAAMPDSPGRQVRPYRNNVGYKGPPKSKSKSGFGFGTTGP